MRTHREVHLLFEDLTEAYDTVPIKTLRQETFRSQTIAAIKQLCDWAYSKIKLVNTTYSNCFLVTKCRLEQNLLVFQMD